MALITVVRRAVGPLKYSSGILRQKSNSGQMLLWNKGCGTARRDRNKMVPKIFIPTPNISRQTPPPSSNLKLNHHKERQIVYLKCKLNHHKQRQITQRILPTWFLEIYNLIHKVNELRKNENEKKRNISILRHRILDHSKI